MGLFVRLSVDAPSRFGTSAIKLAGDNLYFRRDLCAMAPSSELIARTYANYQPIDLHHATHPSLRRLLNPGMGDRDGTSHRSKVQSKPA